MVFAGAGPGAPDLATVRCADALTKADAILYANSLVNPELLKLAKPGCDIRGSADMTLEETMDFIRRVVDSGGTVVRLHTGDPSLYGAVAEQARLLDAEGVEYEVIPGVTAAFAAAAELKVEFTVPEVSQAVVLTRAPGRTPLPEGQELEAFAKTGATMAIYLSVASIDKVVESLFRGGFAETTPAAVVYRASWKDSMSVRGTLADIAEKVRSAGIGRQAVILVGEALSGEGPRSKLYDPTFAHGYRGAETAGNVADIVQEEQSSPTPPSTRFRGRTAVYALTGDGAETARSIAEALPGAEVFLSSGGKGGFAGLWRSVEENWNAFDGHVFVMAVGIVVRKIAKLMKGKTVDPAVVVCDDTGKFAISLLSGHLGGANRLAEDVADAIGATPVVTTSTDVHGLMAFDELAAVNGWKIENPSEIKTLNTLLLEGAEIAVSVPGAVFERHYKATRGVFPVDPEAIPSGGLGNAKGAVLLDPPEGFDPGIPTLRLRRAAEEDG